MDPRTLNILNRLPNEVYTTLEQNRGNGNSVWSLLELYRESGYITADEETLLYNEYIIPTANHNTPSAPFQQNYNFGNAQPAFNAQPETNSQYQYNHQQYASPNPETEAKARALYTAYLNTKKAFKAGVFMSIVFLFVALIVAPSSFLSETDTPSDLSYNIAEVSSGTDYFIKDAVIFGLYAEYYETPENIKEGEEIPENKKTVTDDFYIGVVTDNYENQYLTSFSFKHNSDIAKELRDFDFDNYSYDLSAYFNTKNLSSYVSDVSTETVAVFFDETIDELLSYDDYDVEILEWNFEYLHPEDYDYAEAAEESKSHSIVFCTIGLLLACGMIALTVSHKKKQKKFAAELASLGYKV